ncbi:ricin-type beta-trefoil lectin domain protein [Nocardia sp. NPDC059229]|uniref:GH12 family glycosyl hydrolase domain-containing protein n=1 Tax=Nocardia sp. NPDC059229 TaxID=3346778 RepID=UPI0036AB67CF
MPAPRRLFLRNRSALLCLVLAAYFLAPSLADGGMAGAADGDLCSSQQTALVSGGRYAIRNNNYGKAAECIRPYDDSGFTVTESAASGGGQDGAPVAYPEIFDGCHWDVCTQNSRLPIKVDEIGAARSSWSTSRASDTTGDYDVAYDLWFNSSAQTTGQPDGAELMIWLDRQPPGPPPTDSTVSWVNRTAFHTWIRTISANNTSWPMIAYQLVSPTGSVDLDMRSFIRDAVVRGVIKPSQYLVAVEAGFEIWSGGKGLRIDSFSAAERKGYLVGSITSGTADICVTELGDTAGTAGNPIGIDHCGGGSRQQWTVAIDGTIRHGGMCMGTTGAMIALHPCNGSPYQVWLPSGSGGLWNLGTSAQNNDNGLCLRDPSEAGAPGTQLDLVNCDGSSPAQNWSLPVSVLPNPA